MSSRTENWLALMGLVYVAVALLGGVKISVSRWIHPRRPRTDAALKLVREGS